MQENNWIKYKTYIIEIFVLCLVLVFGIYLYLDYSNKYAQQQNVVSEEILRHVNEGLQENLSFVESTRKVNSNLDIDSENKLQQMQEANEKEIENYEREKIRFNEERLFEFLNFEKEPKLLDKLMNDLVIKNNSNLTPEDTCKGNDLLEKDECKKSLFVGCAEALYLKFAIVNECIQFQKQDYVDYIKAKRQLILNLEKGKVGEIRIQTSLGEISPSAYTLSQEDLKNTIDSSVLNNNFEKLDLSNVSNESEQITFQDVEDQIRQENTNPENTNQTKGVLNSLLTSLTGVIVKYSGWVQGWATVFAVNNGRPEAGFKMYKTTAFGFNPYRANTCLISLPYKTVDKFFGTNLNYCIRNKLLPCIFSDKEKVKGKPIEVVMLKNGKKGIYPLGDLGPAEWTGNALDVNGCVAKELGATGKDQVRFRVAR